MARKKKKTYTKEEIEKAFADLKEKAKEAGLKVALEVSDATKGAPTLYDPKYCQMLIDHMSQGLSFESFAAIVDSCERTLYNWRDDNPEFLQAYRKGSVQSRLFWERMGNSGTAGHLPGFNASSFKYNMANRFKWTDRQDVTSGGKKLDVPPPAQVIVSLPQNGREAKK